VSLATEYDLLYTHTARLNIPSPLFAMAVSNSFCSGNICCSGAFMASPSVAPFEPADEVRDCPPSTATTKGPLHDHAKNKHDDTVTGVANVEDSYYDDGDIPFQDRHNGPLMELDEEFSTVSSTAVEDTLNRADDADREKDHRKDNTTGIATAATDKNVDDKRRLLKEYQLPSGLSMELPEMEGSTA